MTSLNRARRFVGSGRAVFTGPQAIRFVVDSARTELLQRRAQEAEERLHDRVTGGNYDRIDRVLTLPELARLPLVCPSKILRNERSDRDWSYTAAVRRAARRDHTAEEVAALRGRGGLNPSAEGRP
jgi:hypothetical protein